jgi:hypothetical protein
MQQLDSFEKYGYMGVTLYIQYYTSFGICPAFRIRRKVTDLTTSPCQWAALEHTTYEAASFFHTAEDTRNPDVIFHKLKLQVLVTFRLAVLG